MSAESQNNSNPTANKKANRASKRKQWSDESMVRAMQTVADGLSITGAARELWCTTNYTTKQGYKTWIKLLSK